jgi:hypothetical protein
MMIVQYSRSRCGQRTEELLFSDAVGGGKTWQDDKARKRNQTKMAGCNARQGKAMQCDDAMHEDGS